MRRAILVVLISGASLTILSVVAVAAYLYGYSSAASGGRPLFYEWREHDWGPAWMPVAEFCDKRGTWLFCDMTLNLAVVIVTPPKSISLAINDRRPDHAVLLEDTPYETEVVAQKDTLILAGSHGRQEARLPEGAAGRLYARIYVPVESGEITPLILDELLPLYPEDHPDRGKVEQFIRELD